MRDMKLSRDMIIDSRVINMLIDHFNYSIRDIKSYDELTDAEKEIISEKLFNKITVQNDEE